MTSPDDHLRRQSAIIDTVGWAVIVVLPAEDDPEVRTPFAYTVGLTAHGVPELIIAGVEPPTAAVLLNSLASRACHQAERFAHGQHVDDLIEGYDAVIVDGRPTSDLWPASALRRYGADHVRLQQIVLPDEGGRFPWDDGYAYGPEVQPLVG